VRARASKDFDFEIIHF